MLLIIHIHLKNQQEKIKYPTLWYSLYLTGSLSNISYVWDSRLSIKGWNIIIEKSDYSVKLCSFHSPTCTTPPPHPPLSTQRVSYCMLQFLFCLPTDMKRYSSVTHCLNILLNWHPLKEILMLQKEFNILVKYFLKNVQLFMM